MPDLLLLGLVLKGAYNFLLLDPELFAAAPIGIGSVPRTRSESLIARLRDFPDLLVGIAESPELGLEDGILLGIVEGVDEGLPLGIGEGGGEGGNAIWRCGNAI